MDRNSEKAVDSAYSRLELLIRGYSREKMGLQANVESLRRELGERQKEIDSKNQIINTLVFERDTLVQEREEDEKGRIAVDAEITNFDTKFQIFLDMLSNTQMLVQDMKDRCTKLENNNTTIKRSHLKLFNYCNEIEANNAELGKQLQAKCIEISNLSEKIHHTVERFNSLQADYNTLKALTAEKEELVAAHEMTINQLLGEVERKTQDNLNVSGELTQTSHQLTTLQLEFNELQAAYTSSCSKLIQLEESLKLESKEKENVELEKVKLLAEHEKKLIELMTKLEETKESLKNMTMQKDELVIQNEGIIQGLKGSLDEKNELVSSLNEKLSFADETLSNLNTEKLNLVKTLDDTATKCTEYEKSLALVLKEKDELLTMHGTQVDELKSKIKELTSEIESRLKENLNVSEKLTQTSSQLATLQFEFNELQAEHTSSCTKLSQVEESLKLESQEKENLELEKAKLLAEHEKESTELMTKLEEAQESLKNMTMQKDELVIQNEGIIEGLKGSLDEKHELIRSLNEKLSLADETLSNLNAEKLTILKTLDDTATKCTESEKSLALALEEKDELLTMHHTKVNELVGKVEQLTSDLESVQQKFDYRHGRYEILVKEYRKVFKEYQHLEKLREKEAKAKRALRKRSGPTTPDQGEGMQLSSTPTEHDAPSTSKCVKTPSRNDTAQQLQVPPTTPKQVKKRQSSTRRSVPDTSVQQPSRGILKTTSTSSSENSASGSDLKLQASKTLTPSTSPYKSVSFCSPIYQDFYGLSSDDSQKSGSQQSYP